jgi:hypothetical protein
MALGALWNALLLPAALPGLAGPFAAARRRWAAR